MGHTAESSILQSSSQSSGILTPAFDMYISLISPNSPPKYRYTFSDVYISIVISDMSPWCPF
jgi:hypothetical protein